MMLLPIRTAARCMKTCRRCQGSGWLFRPTLAAGRSRCVRCTDCGGSGTKPRPTTPDCIPLRRPPPASAWPTSRAAVEAADIESEVKQFLKDAPEDSFHAVRRQVEASSRRLASVVPLMSGIEADPVIYRGEHFTKEELAEAEACRKDFPNGDRVSAAQIAYTLRALDRRRNPSPEAA